MIEEFLDQIKIDQDSVKVILDVGSLNGAQSIEFAKAFPNAYVYAFECNEKSFFNCVENIKSYPNIDVEYVAVNDYDGVCKFYPINTEKTVTSHADGNPGASSLFKANGNYDRIEKWVQDEVRVICTRLDTWARANNVKKFDLVWMDLQGAELLALRGMGKLLRTVKFIHTEVQFKPQYSGVPLYSEINMFLEKSGFKKIWIEKENEEFFTNVIYERILV